MELIFPMEKIYINLTNDEKNKDNYIEKVRDEILNMLNKNLQIGTVLWKIKYVISGPIYEICAIIQIEEEAIILLKKVIKRLSNYKCDEKLNITTDNSLTEKDKKSYINQLDKLFRKLNKKIKGVKSGLEIDLKNLNEKYENNNFEPHTIGHGETRHENMIKLKSVMSDKLKSIICNFD